MVLSWFIGLVRFEVSCAGTEKRGSESVNENVLIDVQEF